VYAFYRQHLPRACRHIIINSNKKHKTFFLLVIQSFKMGNFAAVPSFRGSYHVAKRHRQLTATNGTPIPAGERENYHVYSNLQSDIESPLWIAIKNRRKRSPQTNRIQTTRYNILTFLPQNLFEQFHRVANIYFAILIGLNWIPIINAISKQVNICFFYDD